MTIQGFTGVIPRITDGYQWGRFVGFTLGRFYPFIEASGSGGVVINDNGHARFVLLDQSHCGHCLINDLDNQMGIKGWMEPVTR